MSIKETFGQNLRYYRKKKGFSQQELSEKTGITAKHLSAIETGASFVSAELLEQLTVVLGAPAAAFFHAPDEASLVSLLDLVDTVIEEELSRCREIIRLKIRRPPAFE